MNVRYTSGKIFLKKAAAVSTGIGLASDIILRTSKDMNNRRFKPGPISGKKDLSVRPDTIRTIRKQNADRRIVGGGNNVGWCPIPDIVRGVDHQAIIFRYNARRVGKGDENLPALKWPGPVGDQYLSKKIVEGPYKHGTGSAPQLSRGRIAPLDSGGKDADCARSAGSKFEEKLPNLLMNVSSLFKIKKPVGPEQIQDTHEHDYFSLCVSNLKKYKRMKKPIFLFVLILSALFSPGCEQSPRDYSSAENIVLKWELITNFTDVPGTFDARFIFENHSTFELKDNWKLFFNIAPRPMTDPPSPQAARVEHINGDWYQLIPNPGFSLPFHESVEIVYRGLEGVIKESDGPLGAYFVFYNKEGDEEQIVEVDCEILPFTKPEQVNRNAQDEEPIPTAEYRYHNNKALSKLPKDKLHKIIPSPVSIRPLGGTTVLNPDWEIVYEDGLENEADFLVDKLNHFTGALFGSSTKSSGQNKIELCTDKISVHGISREAYHLDIKHGSIRIAGSDPAGVFYGVQSLLSLIPLEVHKSNSKSIELKLLSVRDSPRFGFRGLHTDLGRNFQDKETILRILDISSFYKINRYLFYMTEDEGWRLEIPGLPELTEVGGQREHTSSYHDPVLHPAYGSGPIAYGKGSRGSGYISRADFIEILKYAATRHIKVIPEVNFPAHARSSIKPMEARYRRFMAEGKEEEANEYRLIDPDDQSVYLSAQSFKDNVVSVARPSTYRFYKKVMDEIALMYEEAGLTLDEIHAGGDEVPEGAWTKSPLAAELTKANSKFKDPKNLQAYFVRRLLDTLKENNYTVHGWEEHFLKKNEQGGYDPNPEFVGDKVVAYVWNNLYGMQDLAYRIANAGYNIVMCPVSNFYFDLAYDKDPKEPGLYWAGFVRTRDAWSFAPYDIFKTTTHTAGGRKINREEEYAGMVRLNPEARKRILGVEAQLWSETIKGRGMIEYYMLPKLLGFAESAWAKERKWETIESAEVREKLMDEQWNVFANTLAQKELPRLSYLNGSYNYRIPLPGAVIEGGKLMANTEFPGLELRYTTDGSEPSSSARLYEGPVEVTGTVRMKAFDSSGKSSREIFAGSYSAGS
ncbi:MAG: family 20 glycosylhydrolase [Cytophagales bacterium]|nr:family 20 glycosylhydrolase [Cytophagales bacterium]